RGLYFQSAYTYSKTIDNVSGSQSTDELNGTRNAQSGANLLNFAIQDPTLNRARGDFDRPHRLVISYNYDLPVPKAGILGSQAFQGWAISGITTFQNGLPFNVFSAGGAAFGGGTATPLLVCNAVQNPSLPTCTPGTPTTIEQATMSGDVQNNLAHFVNPNFFSLAPLVPNGAAGATGYGNTPRNAFRAPFQQSWDFSLSKKFNITESHVVTFRADLFNAFNHPIF